MKKKDLLIARKKFLGVCPICGQPLKKMKDVNILRCENFNCQGVKLWKNGVSHYEPYYKLLSDKSMKTYNYLFKNKTKKE